MLLAHIGRSPASLDLSILYRGSLSSCNYDCPYCPFAKHYESADELAADRHGLERFTNWIDARTADRLAVFFTPWGEALVRAWYRQAMIRLSKLTQVDKVAVQTNLSCNLDWLADADTSKLGFWCTYHPGQTSRRTFLAQCAKLTDLGIAHSVGCVGLREHLEEIRQLRHALPNSTYLWINAYKSLPGYYDTALLTEFESIDSLFPLNNTRHSSIGRACRTGSTVITVDSHGAVRRCHFVDNVLGNLYDSSFQQVLAKRPCPNANCGCHIGYVHLEHLQLQRVFGERMLERIPIGWGDAG
jgi:hypothetical protein